MPLGTLDRTPPPFFKQGTSAFTKLMLFSAAALFLMVADTRLGLSGPLRSGVAAVLFPIQWAVLQPVRLVAGGGAYLQSLESAQEAEQNARLALARSAARTQRVEQLELENRRLRLLLGLREQAFTDGQAAQVLYDAADPFTRKVVIDLGQLSGVQAGSPVIDESGVVGQVTRVYAMVSEVTLLTDRSQAIPVLNARTGERSVAFGDPQTLGGSLELRFMGTNSDVQDNDLLTTSGVDGVYPPGLAVARVTQVERRAESSFARIHAQPLALLSGVRQVMVLAPLAQSQPARPEAAGPLSERPAAGPLTERSAAGPASDRPAAGPAPPSTAQAVPASSTASAPTPAPASGMVARRPPNPAGVAP